MSARSPEHDNTTRLYFDTEFIEDGERIHPLAVAVVDDNDDWFYGVTTDTDRDQAGDWVRENVLPYLDLVIENPEPGQYVRGPAAEVGQALRRWVAERTDEPEFWADYAAYDWVLLCQMFGTMLDLPAGWPMFVRDIQQIRPAGLPLSEPEQAHNALSDARNVRDRYYACRAALASTAAPGRVVPRIGPTEAPAHMTEAERSAYALGWNRAGTEAAGRATPARRVAVDDDGSIWVGGDCVAMVYRQEWSDEARQEAIRALVDAVGAGRATATPGENPYRAQRRHPDYRLKSSAWDEGYASGLAAGRGTADTDPPGLAGLDTVELTKVARYHLEAIRVLEGAEHNAEMVRRVAARMSPGWDEAADDDFQAQLANPVAHYGGGRSLGTAEWPEGAPPPDLTPDPAVHVEALRLIVGALARRSSGDHPTEPERPGVHPDPPTDRSALEVDPQ